MKVDVKGCPFPVSRELQTILEGEIAKEGKPLRGPVIVTFRDPDYSPERGGFHPVEIRIGPAWGIEYITDFAYVGLPPFAELAKEIDFDFRLGLFQHFGREHPIGQGRELFAIWQENFISYYAMGLYEVSVSLE